LQQCPHEWHDHLWPGTWGIKTGKDREETMARIVDCRLSIVDCRLLLGIVEDEQSGTSMILATGCANPGAPGRKRGFGRQQNPTELREFRAEIEREA